MRRLAPLLAAALVTVPAGPAPAWEIRPGPVCEMAHEGESGTVRVTYDPAIGEYAITLTRMRGPWPDAAAFAITFRGAEGLTISTGRHVLSEGGRALTVRDRGFGNVLRGLEAGGSARAFAGAAEMEIDLAAAPPVVAAFRACRTTPAV
jgi:hypothetical protein